MKTVRYIDLGHCVTDEPAMVIPLDHPGPGVSNRIWAKTSPVQRILTRRNGDVEFWTMNTHYRPADPGSEISYTRQRETTR